jgi:hypothetical protein
LQAAAKLQPSCTLLAKLNVRGGKMSGNSLLAAASKQLAAERTAFSQERDAAQAALRAERTSLDQGWDALRAASAALEAREVKARQALHGALAALGDTSDKERLSEQQPTNEQDD